MVHIFFHHQQLTLSPLVYLLPPCLLNVGGRGICQKLRCVCLGEGGWQLTIGWVIVTGDEEANWKEWLGVGLVNTAGGVGMDFG